MSVLMQDDWVLILSTINVPVVCDEHSSTFYLGMVLALLASVAASAANIIVSGPLREVDTPIVVLGGSAVAMATGIAASAIWRPNVTSIQGGGCFYFSYTYEQRTYSTYLQYIRTCCVGVQK